MAYFSVKEEPLNSTLEQLLLESTATNNSNACKYTVIPIDYLFLIFSYSIRVNEKLQLLSTAKKLMLDVNEIDVPFIGHQ